MVTVTMDEHLVENWKAIEILRELHMPDDEIQKIIDRQYKNNNGDIDNSMEDKYGGS